MQTLQLANGKLVPRLGLGTWHMGESARSKSAEIAALKLGLDLGMTLIDTAEMYGEGGAETVVGEAITGQREGVYLVSKVYPHHASRAGAIAACERSLKRLRTDTIDLYLLHWRGAVPLPETITAFEQLQRDGKIRSWGVSNFDTDDMGELMDTVGGRHCMANQVLYHLGERGIEWRLLPDAQKANVMIMAYSPLGQGPLLLHPTLTTIGNKHAATPAAVALAFILRQRDVVAIPKATSLDHVRANAKAVELQLDRQDLEELDRVFPAPTRTTPLAMI